MSKLFGLLQCWHDFCAGCLTNELAAVRPAHTAWLLICRVAVCLPQLLFSSENTCIVQQYVGSATEMLRYAALLV